MSTQWVPLHCHSAYSLLDSIVRPKILAKRCAELSYKACSITDHGSISGAIDHSVEMRNQGVLPILGNEIYLCDGPSTEKSNDNRSLSHLVVLSRSFKGYKQLLKLASRSNEKERLYYKPRLNIEELREFATGDLLAFSGHPGSDLGDVIFKSPKAAYGCTSYEEIRTHHIHEDATERLCRKIEQYVSIFGKENFFLEVQLLDPEGMPASIAIAKALRWASKRFKIPCVATADSHYVYREDAADQRVLLCSKLRTTLNRVRQKVEDDEEVDMGGFFRSDCFHLPSLEEMQVHHTDQEIQQSVEIASMIEDYDITTSPKIPSFAVPPGHSQDSYLQELTRSGWDRLIANQDLPKPIEEYEDRLKMEMGVIQGAGLSSYFLIVQDVMRFSRERGRFLGVGRGSSAGCLISYLTGITQVDPLKYDLLFERFYNAGRNAPGRISLPDIDCDFPISEREHVFRYLQQTYGSDKVGKISTYQTMQGASALSETMAAHEIPFDVRKTITAFIPDRAKISEELQAMAERGEEPSSIRFALDVYGDELSEWVTLNSDDTLSGEFAPYFAQAMRLEGLKKNKSTHAAGVVISDSPLSDIVPVRWDDEGNLIVDIELGPLEASGGMKLDVLGVAMLDKLEGIRNLAKTGRL